MRRKILVVTRSEFMRRVTSKTFIVTTLLGPLLLVGFFAVTIMISLSTLKDDFVGTFGANGMLRIGIVDETGVLGGRIIDRGAGENAALMLIMPDSLDNQMTSGDVDAYVRIPAEMITADESPILYSVDGDARRVQWTLSETIEWALKDYLLAENNISANVRAILDRSVFLEILTNDAEEETGEEAEAEEGYYILGLILGTLMYMGILIYGTLIMYAAMEERTTRVVEVLVSSVRPFELLMGKVLGIGLVGFAQMAVWGIMIVGGTVLASPVIGLFMDPATYDLPASATNQEILAAAEIVLPGISPGLFIWFILYFVGGYLLYGGLFAAVGTMVDSPQESQGLLLPLMMPIIISIIFMGPIMIAPNGPLAVGLSLVPLTSSVPMITRIAIGAAPVWQIILSYGLLLGSFLTSIWVSARIYRASLLMYGKKPSLKTLVGYLRSG